MLLKIIQKKDIRNLLHANIDLHSRRLIAELPKYGIKCIEKLQSHCANMSIGNMICQTHLRAKTLILPMTVITYTSDAKIRNIGKRIR